MSAFTTGDVLAIWTPFFRLKIGIQEVGCVEVGAGEELEKVKIGAIPANVLSKDRCLEWLRLHCGAKARL